MYKIAVIGGNDSVIGFKALGLTTFPVDGPESAKKLDEYFGKSFKRFEEAIKKLKVAQRYLQLFYIVA